MNEKITTNSVKYSPVALAVVLFTVLGLLAFQARAEEGDVLENDLQDEMQGKMQENIDARRALYEEQTEERKAQFEENRSEFEELRSESPDQEDVATLRTQVQEESQSMFEEHREERNAFYSEQKEMMYSMFEERKKVLKERMEERKQDREQNREEVRAKLSAKRQEALTQYSERIVERMSVALERLEQIADRIDGRIEKMEAKGVDLSDAKNVLDDAYTLLESAEGSVALIGPVSIDTITSDDPVTQKDEIRATVLLAKESIVEIHKTLSEAVQLIKATFPTPENEAEDGIEDGGEIVDDRTDNTGEVISISDSFSEGVHTYTGEITTPTPCHSVSAEAVVAESFPEQVSIAVSVKADDSGLACIQVEEEQQFSVEATASKQASVVAVTVDGDDVEWKIVE